MYNERKPTFGEAVVSLRRGRGLNQKELAGRVQREDGSAISPAYLNDIEHGRRNPSSDHLIQQFATALEADPSFLTFLAGQLPPEIRDLPLDQDKLRAALNAFRAVIEA
jgi:transcriptional regulator with XRE-family HTH domain